MGIRRTLKVENTSRHTCLLRYKDQAIGIIIPNKVIVFAINDHSGLDNFTLLAESDLTQDIWEEEVEGDFDDLEWEIK